MGGGKDSQSPSLSAKQNLLLGTLAGCGTKMINYPLLSSKNFKQQGLPLSLSPKVLYRGLPVGMMSFGATCGSQFLFTAAFQRQLVGGSRRKFTAREEVLSAFLGGLFSGVPCSIWELTMIQQQRFGGSILSIPLNLMQNHGIPAITRGMMSSMGRESLFAMAMLGLCPVLQRELMDRYSMPEQSALAGSALSASLFSGTLTHPLDTIKTCMQGDVAQQKYSSMRGTAALLVAENGIAQGLFKGLGFRISLIATTFFLVNQWKQALTPFFLSSRSWNHSDLGAILSPINEATFLMSRNSMSSCEEIPKKH